MKLPIASLNEEIFISIVYGCVNISRHESLPGTTSSVMTFFYSVSMLHLLNVIAGGGVTLNFLRGLKAKDTTAPCIQNIIHFGIYFGRENALWDR